MIYGPTSSLYPDVIGFFNSLSQNSSMPRLTVKPEPAAQGGYLLQLDAPRLNLYQVFSILPDSIQVQSIRQKRTQEHHCIYLHLKLTSVMSTQYIIDSGTVTGAESTETLQEALTLAEQQVDVFANNASPRVQYQCERLQRLITRILTVLNSRRGLDGMTPVQL